MAAKTTMGSGMAINIKDIQNNVDIDGDGKLDPEEQEIIDLLKRMDVDGDGTIGLRELVNLGNSMNESKKETSKMRKMLYAACAVMLLVCVVMFCVCMAAVEAAKDSKPSASGKLETVDGKTISVNANKEALTIQNLYSFDLKTLRSLEDIGYAQGGVSSVRKIVGVDLNVLPGGTKVLLHLANGDRITNSKTETTLTMADNTKVDLAAAAAARKHHRRRHLLAEEDDGSATVNGDPAEMEYPFDLVGAAEIFDKMVECLQGALAAGEVDDSLIDESLIRKSTACAPIAVELSEFTKNFFGDIGEYPIFTMMPAFTERWGDYGGDDYGSPDDKPAP